MDVDLSGVLAAIDTTWDALREQHPEIPVVVVGIDMRGKKHALDYREATVTGEEVPPLLEVPMECIREGGRAVVSHVLHVAVHALADARGIPVTNNRGRRHNRKFADVARELGREWPEDRPPDPSHGYAPVPIMPETWTFLEPYAVATQDVIDRTDAVAALDMAAPRRGTSGQRLTLRCGCDRTLQIGRRQAAKGPITCGVCGEEFSER
ncbi:hypothetical protein [Streptomyces sp. NPDC101393]|uniref:hypothetical protein n=1 Tax=Streptomyces sp. NPDC101393 TaxID=3366141 RepID=UPI0038273203